MLERERELELAAAGPGSGSDSGTAAVFEASAVLRIESSAAGELGRTAMADLQTPSVAAALAAFAVVASAVVDSP
jgi:hypothetical protein